MPGAKKLRHLLHETETFNYPESFQNRIEISKQALNNPVLGSAIATANQRQHKRFIEQYDEQSKPQGWISKVFTTKSEEPKSSE